MERIYIIKCYNNEEEFVKVGITSHEVKRRFNSPCGGSRSMPYKYDIIFQYTGKVRDIYDCESKIGDIFQEDRYQPRIFFPGRNECYNMNVLDDILIHTQYFLKI